MSWITAARFPLIINEMWLKCQIIMKKSQLNKYKTFLCGCINIIFKWYSFNFIMINLNLPHIINFYILYLRAFWLYAGLLPSFVKTPQCYFTFTLQTYWILVNIQRETDYRADLILCVTATCIILPTFVNIWAQTCFLSFSFQDHSDKIFFAFLNFISLLDNCLE